MCPRLILDSWSSCHPTVEMMNMEHCAWFLQCWRWNLRLWHILSNYSTNRVASSAFLQLLSLALWSVSMLTCLPEEFVHNIFSPCICNGFTFRLNYGSGSRASGIAGLSLWKYAKCQLKWWQVYSSTQSGRPVKILSSSLLSQMGVNEPEYLIWDVYWEILVHICSYNF